MIYPSKKIENDISFHQLSWYSHVIYPNYTNCGAKMFRKTHTNVDVKQVCGNIYDFLLDILQVMLFLIILLIHNVYRLC